MSSRDRNPAFANPDTRGLCEAATAQDETRVPDFLSALRESLSDATDNALAITREEYAANGTSSRFYYQVGDLIRVIDLMGGPSLSNPFTAPVTKKEADPNE